MPNTTCATPSCDEPPICYGHCPRHVIDYIGWTETSTGCHEWSGTRSDRGYPLLGDKKRTRVHRLSWEIANGRSIPTGQVVRHRCDNPPCVNPDHLRIGTEADNVLDAIRRGRRPVLLRDMPNAADMCGNGHDLTKPDALVVASTPSGRRRAWCRTCRHEWDKAYLRRKAMT